ncbi:Retrovirus-related Pol polyprotein from transposon TNT 1-94 [Sesamum angolense]|uniref:Retrovirus-related Pol polyprotein from transposon TNT 1-94 n=1 Tax=Sesamum angolense TaxID=2727404 RepID=A0AAE2C531_9LAMI|nr:Retrovirus-related Pol polyprotein from transposon TNT 1-94 [Sesamum angolense]
MEESRDPMKETIKVDEIIAALLAHNQQKHNVGESSHDDSLYVKGNQDRGWKSANMVQNENSDYGDGDMLSVSTNEYVDAWNLDFVCFYHITPNREWFTSDRLGYEDMVSFALLISGDEPTTFHVAITSQEKEWMGAMVEEMESLQKNHTCELVQLLEGKKTIGCKAMDVKQHFCMVIWRNRFTWSSHTGSLKLDISIWFTDNKRCEYDCCVYVKSLNDSSSIFGYYVDDMLIGAKNMHDVLTLKALLSQEFEMKDVGATTKILGMEIHKDRGSRKLWLSQRGYVEKMLDRFGMSKAKPGLSGGNQQFSLLWHYLQLKQHTTVVEAAKEALLLNGLAKELGVEQGGVQLHCDSQSAIYLAKNHAYHARTKQIM